MLKRAKYLALGLVIVAFAATSALSAEESVLNTASESLPSAQTEAVSPDKTQGQPPSPEEAVSMDLQGNSEINRDHIMSVVTSKVGQHVDEEKLRKDAEAIFELGFFNATDYKVTDEGDGVKVTFLVQENPKVGEIKFIGNTVYSEDKLKSAIFTQPGMIFNRTFFRTDLPRLKERYQEVG